MAVLGTDRHRTMYLKGGEQQFGRSFLEVFGFTEGLGAVRDRRGAYFIDENGKPLTQDRYIRAYPFMNGLAAVEDELGMFHMDRNGKQLYSRRFGWVSGFHDGLCAARYRNGTYTYIDMSGNPWNDTFRYCEDFSEGRGIVLTDEGFGFVDTSGNALFGKHYEYCHPFDNGKAAVKENGRWHMIDSEGNGISGEVDHINIGRNGLFTGTDKGYFGYFDRNMTFCSLFRLQDKVEFDETPAWTDDILEFDWDSCVVFMRHSERYSHYLCNDMSIGKTGLTRHGDELARSIGTKIRSLNDRTISGYCSSAPRCITTANCIIGAMGAKSNIATSQEIGPAGNAFICDMQKAWEAKGLPDTLECMKIISGEDLPGWYSREDVISNIRTMVEKLTDNDGSLTFCVSHDWFIIMVAAYVTGRFPSNEWADYCDGILLLKRKGEYFAVWKGKEYPLKAAEGPVDVSKIPSKIQMNTDGYTGDREWEGIPKDRIAWSGKTCDGFTTVCDREGRFFHGGPGEYTVYSRTFDYAEDFSEQSAAVFIKGQGASYVTDFGDFLHNRWFLEAGSYHEGLAAVRTENGWNYIDPDGNIVIAKDFDEAYGFHHGEALVFTNGIPNLIDREGNVRLL